MNKACTAALVQLIFVCMFVSTGIAQGNIAAPRQQQPTQDSSATNKLALEVTYYRDAPPTYMSAGSAVWYGWFRRVASWQQPAGSLPVLAVNIVTRLEGDAVEVKVSVYEGVRFHDKEEFVASYIIRESEKISVRELTRFGVEPFEIEAVRVAPTAAGLPLVENKTNSINVLGIETNNSPLLSYKLSLQNLSNKNVNALSVRVLVDGKVQMSGLPHADEGKPLIKAGETYVLNVYGATRPRQTPNGYAPDAPPVQTILIATAVYDSGSYEGEAAPAANFKAFVEGRKIQLARIIALLQNALESTEPNTSAAIEELRVQFSSLGDDVSVATMEELERGFPTFDRKAKDELKTAVQVAMHGVRNRALEDIKQFGANREQALSANAFRAWLSATKEGCSAWLARLQ